MRVITLFSWIRNAFAAIAMFMMSSLAAGQDAATASPPSQAGSRDDNIRELQAQMSELKSVLAEVRAEMLRSHTETIELRQELQTTRQQLAAIGLSTNNVSHPTGEAGPPGSVMASPQSQGGEETIQKLEEEQQLSNAKLKELHQAKVESASKYPVRLSGLILLNLFSNRGVVNNLDYPTLVVPDRPIDSRGGFGASLRQSLFGLEIFGPRVRGARVSADVQFDFAGGFPNALDGVTMGLLRLRTGVIRMEWPNTTLVAGQDIPFFSPLSPSSIASLALPAFSYAGNLWTWTPQVRLEHRFEFTNNSSVLLQAGILDPLTGEPPISQFLRVPQAGEASRQPAYAARVAWSRRILNRQLTLGMGGYYSRQDWGFHRTLDGWAGTSDWTIPVGNRWELSGEFYRGRALGGLGGGIGRSVLSSGPITDPRTQVRGLNATGGWAQVKFRQTEKLEWNAAFGQDNSLAQDLRRFSISQSYFDPSLARNRSSLLNFIYRPRSDLLISGEYRRLRTFTIQGDSDKADQINLSMGVLF
ncbi:MAG TPA: hypothetical protein VOA64_03365 [Candidatus Dormibacteraeota bacterium]|nr:hypothetical protein [Candidatus Dormibacteraeota bacterium]